MSSHVDCGLHPCYFFWHSFPDRQQIITTKKTILESFCFALRAILELSPESTNRVKIFANELIRLALESISNNELLL